MLILSMFLGRSFAAIFVPPGCRMCGRCQQQTGKAGQKKSNKVCHLDDMDSRHSDLIYFWRGTAGVDVLYMTDHGVSVTEIANYVVYYAVILLLLLPSLIHGRRAACHYICWMAPFMIIGEKTGQMLHIPQLHVSADNRKCISCKKCETVCPMGLKVEQMVKDNNHCQCIDCIQCGACVDSCPKNVLSYSWKAERRV